MTDHKWKADQQQVGVKCADCGLVQSDWFFDREKELRAAWIDNDRGWRDKVDALRADNERLKEQVTSLLTTLTQDEFPDPTILHEKCRREIERLRAALVKYGDHLPTCSHEVLEAPVCGCGFDQAKASQS